MRAISLLVAVVLLTTCSDNSEKVNSHETLQAWILDFMERYGTSMDKAIAENDTEELQNLYVKHVCECYSLVGMDQTRESLNNFTKVSLEKGKVDDNALGVILTQNHSVKMYQFCKEWEDGYSGFIPTDNEKAVLAQRIEVECGSDKKQVSDDMTEMVEDFRGQMVKAGLWEEPAQ
jgi:hypothetical protein